VIRTSLAGDLRRSDDGTTVVLAGWVARRRDHGGVAFVDLRDAGGTVQVVFREGEMAEAAHPLRDEWCVAVTGTVALRPAGNENPDIATGDVEVLATALEVLSEAAPLPFPVHEHAAEPAEEVRLRHRYLDLRRLGPAAALRLRAKTTSVIRRAMEDAGFLDIDTPMLTRSTPEGARDFLVPVRLQPGTWYALPQSPQLFKQLLMVAGVERYFQIARCFRDEDFRADRQPEFTQLDVEMSFPSTDDVLELTETVLARVWREVLGVDLPTPFPRLTHAEAMRRFGSDKPDTRFGLELVDLTSYFAGTGFRVFQAEHVGAVVMPGGASQTRRELDGWQEWARGRGARGLAYVLVEESGLRGPVAKNLSDGELAGLAEAAGAQVGDAVFFAAGEPAAARELLGAARLQIARDRQLIPEGRWDLLWVTDFPMFEPTEDGGWTAVHHPFTRPAPEFEADFENRPGEAIAVAYDVVLNGTELGGGSLRIHEPELQSRVFEAIGLSRREAESKFDFLLEAFRYGPPPHGGIALGLDRLCALLAGVDSIRDVIAFPKTASGGDPLTGAPTPITAVQRRDAGIDARPAPSAGAAPPASRPAGETRPDSART
jgi:aspartyl-tRNA synthetase